MSFLAPLSLLMRLPWYVNSSRPSGFSICSSGYRRCGIEIHDLGLRDVNIETCLRAELVASLSVFFLINVYSLMTKQLNHQQSPYLQVGWKGSTGCL